ncbi:hypothetical protein EBH_0044160 [Eimeria brunetti]|uniref:Uncharacterized protein n=1 Tax=Eimeria brunetti TaxID=51314 RepID=U6M2H2_9EIME|nr:hypothetical protein EBH_0044160 [Eimeria brunetti]
MGVKACTRSRRIGVYYTNAYPGGVCVYLIVAETPKLGPYLTDVDECIWGGSADEQSVVIGQREKEVPPSSHRVLLRLTMEVEAIITS